MSCQSLAARAFAEPEKDHCSSRTTFHRTVRFSSDSRSQTTRTSNDTECKRETSGSMSLSALAMTPVSQGSSMSQSAPSASTNFDIDDTPHPPPACRFPKLEECAHFHYERVSLGGISVELVPSENTGDSPIEGEGWVSLKVRSHVNTPAPETDARALSTSWTEASDVREWTLTRNREHFTHLDDMLHRCIYDRKVSGLPNLKEAMTSELLENELEYRQLIADYVHHLSIIADDSINCGPALNWLQMDNRGHKLLVSNEDSSSINTPAVAAAYSVRKYVSQARDEISFEVGDMISIIDMPVLYSPGPQESVWWRGKRGFRVGFFPHNCVAVIGDKVPRNMTQPPPIVGSVAVAPIKPVLRKHGKLISLFRSFILSRPSRRSLKQQGILRERVFGCDLGEHLLNCGHDVPQVLVACSSALERRGAVDGIYRLSGGAALTQRLRAAFDAALPPALAPPDLAPPALTDPHALASLLKMYFRELPNPLCTYQLYESFVRAVQEPEPQRLRAVRETVVKLPPPHYRTLSYLMRHLRRVSLLHQSTGMTARNMAIVWAPNLLRSPHPQHALQGVAVQAVVTEFLICYAEELFSQEQGADSGPNSLEQDQYNSHIELRGLEASRRPKSLPLNPPTKLLSLEEARRRGQSSICESPPVLRPAGHLQPKYIEVGSGPNNLPQYHTVLDLPVPGAKRSLKRSPSGWRGLFSRSKLQRAPPTPDPEPVPVHMNANLRPAKSCESLSSETDALPPLTSVAAPLKNHTRSSSCDSYFEPWQAELAGMRLRLSPQERDRHMFSEEDDTNVVVHHQDDSLCSSPPESGACSAVPSPRRNRFDTDFAERKRVALEQLEQQVAQLGYIDGEPDTTVPDKRPAAAKRLCKDRDSPLSSTSDFQTSLAHVKLRERNSPRKQKNISRYSGLHHPVLTDPDKPISRLTWHGGKDGHSTLIKIDWPAENSSISNLTNSTMNSNPLTPVTPNYDPLESDSELSDNKHTITIKSADCNNCDEEKCLKCELNATDYEHMEDVSRDMSEHNLHDSLEASPLHSADVSYQNLNRLSAVSTSSNSDHHSFKKDELKVMTSSHESSSGYSNVSYQRHDELYECYNFARPNYINLSSSTSKSSPGSPLKSPLKSTISITFRSPVKMKTDYEKPDYELIDNTDTPTNERDSVYEDIDLDKNLSIVEDATVPQSDASLPTQQACQPQDFNQDLIILETPTESTIDNVDVYSQVKFFRKSIEEVNAMILETPDKETEDYENVPFGSERDYENINVDTLKICDKIDISKHNIEKENGNVIKPNATKNLNVRELATRFESPTEQKGPFTFEKFKSEIKYPSLERKEEKDGENVTKNPPSFPKTYKLSKNSNARSLDENAFIKEFGSDKDRRKSLEVKDVKRQSKYLPDLNLNMEEPEIKLESITPTTENKLSLIQRFDVKKPAELKNIIGFDTEKKLSRERIEKYKEERRNFLREKYSSQSFRSNPEQLTRIKLKKDDKDCDRLKHELPKFERRNTVDLGQRMRFSLAKSANNLDTIPSPLTPEDLPRNGETHEQTDRREKVSPSYNIRDMAAIFEQKSQNNAYVTRRHQKGTIGGVIDEAATSARQHQGHRLCKDRDSPLSSTSDFQTSLAHVKLRERNSPRKQKNISRYSGLHHPVLTDPDKPISRLTWHGGKDGHSTLIKIDWPAENSSISNLTNSTMNSNPLTPVTPNYDPLESDSELSENKHTITIKSADCNNCDEEKCLKCELNATDYEHMEDVSRDMSEHNLHDSLEASPLHSADVSYQNLNRLSAVSTSSNSDHHSFKKDELKVMTSSHESSSGYSNVSYQRHDELYECYNFARPNYINLSSSTSKSSPGSPLKSPLKSTISITFRSPVKMKTDYEKPDYELIGNTDTPTNERDSVYEDIDLDKNLSIVEDATVPQSDASLPTQQACQPQDFNQDLIILETPTESTIDNVDVYSQVKFFRKSIEEVNAMILETPDKETEDYENVPFGSERDYENINVDTLKICDKIDISKHNIEKENGNVIKPNATKNLNVRELATRFESPTEQKGPFTFEKFKSEIKYPSLERKEEKDGENVTKNPPSFPKTYKLSKNSNARSLDENAFIKEFGSDKDRRKSLEVKDVKRQSKYLPDLNLNMEEPEIKLESITPTTENKLSLIQRFDVKKPTELKNIIGFDTEKKLSRERIEKYKEERRNFLREKYSSQSFRSNPEQLTRIKLKKDDKDCDRLKHELPKFERRNTVDLGQRMRFSLAKSANNLDTIPSPLTPEDLPRNGETHEQTDRREKVSPSYNIRDMAAIFEQKSQNNG